jgi:hypothetical protein
MTVNTAVKQLGQPPAAAKNPSSETSVPTLGEELADYKKARDKGKLPMGNMLDSIPPAEEQIPFRERL